jgi:arylsulfatase A-like enzyme
MLLAPTLRLIALPAVALLAGQTGSAAAGATRPNIVLILSDDHSVPHLGAYGSPNPKTPALDAFAAQGMRFQRMHTTAPQCAPSRGSIFTGRSPIANDSTRFTQPARADHPFFTDVLRQHGYWVGLDGRTHHLSGRRGGEDHENEALRAAGLDYIERRFDHVRLGGPQNGEGFAAALDQVPPGKPFFLYFGFSQPHRGFPPPPPEHAGLFRPEKLQLPPDWPDLPEVRADYARYLYKVYRLDRGFAGVMEVLEKRKLAGNTLVVFMGDNGEALLRGKGTLYQRGTNVPLIVRWPGVVAPGTRSDILLSGEDVGPTILDAVGLDVPATMTGVSFAPALRGQPYPGREYVYTERGWHWGPVTRTDGLDLSRAIISARYKLIYNLLPDRPYHPVDMGREEVWRELVHANRDGRLSARHQQLIFPQPQRPIFELFDLENDPYEMTNLAGKKEFQEIETKLRIALSKWMVREGDYLPIPSLRYPAHHEFSIFHDQR